MKLLSQFEPFFKSAKINNHKPFKNNRIFISQRCQVMRSWLPDVHNGHFKKVLTSNGLKNGIWFFREETYRFRRKTTAWANHDWFSVFFLLILELIFMRSVTLFSNVNAPQIVYFVICPKFSQPHSRCFENCRKSLNLVLKK